MSVERTLLLLLCTKTFCSRQPCQISMKFRRFGAPLYPHHDDKFCATEKEREVSKNSVFNPSVKRQIKREDFNI